MTSTASTSLQFRKNMRLRHHCALLAVALCMSVHTSTAQASPPVDPALSPGLHQTGAQTLPFGSSGSATKQPAPRITDRQATAARGFTEKQAQLLAQFYTAEYSALMARTASWASLQYALFSLLMAFTALLVNMKNAPADFRLWTFTGVLAVGYLAYQGVMLDALQNVLHIEQYLKPRAIQLVATDQFWFHECAYRLDHVQNFAYWKYWPPLICLSAIAVTVLYIRFHDGLHRRDYVFAAIALLLALGVLDLTRKGSRLDSQIIERCKLGQAEQGSR
jgi:hypothetical protein